MMGYPSNGTVRTVRKHKQMHKLSSQATVVIRRLKGLSAQPESLNDGAVSFNVIILDVVEQASASPNQHEQSSAGMMVLFVNFQMLR
jgi:hypothetical protein